MRWLRGAVNNDVRSDRCNQRENAGTIANVKLVMVEPVERRDETALIPSRVTLRPEENGALIIIDAVYQKSLVREERTYFRSDKAR